MKRYIKSKILFPEEDSTYAQRELAPELSNVEELRNLAEKGSLDSQVQLAILHNPNTDKTTKHIVLKNFQYDNSLHIRFKYHCKYDRSAIIRIVRNALTSVGNRVDKNCSFERYYGRDPYRINSSEKYCECTFYCGYLNSDDYSAIADMITDEMAKLNYEVIDDILVLEDVEWID